MKQLYKYTKNKLNHNVNNSDFPNPLIGTRFQVIKKNQLHQHKNS